MIRVLSVSRRVGAVSERGCTIAVEYIREGEPKTHTAWLDDFIDEHCEGVTVGADGVGRSLRTDGGGDQTGSERSSIVCQNDRCDYEFHDSVLDTFEAIHNGFEDRVWKLARPNPDDIGVEELHFCSHKCVREWLEG